jgi:HEAT repeat protein
MLRRLFSFEIDRLSFWIGFFAGILFLWVINRIRAWLPELRDYINKSTTHARVQRLSGIDGDWRRVVYQQCQKAHITRDLFSLEEVIFPPKLIAPPPAPAVDLDEIRLTTIAEKAIPYTPDWPELSAQFSTPKITLAEAMQNKVKIAVIGKPGIGKTVSLAYLASLISKHAPEAAQVRDCVPVFLHIMDIHTEIPPKKLAIDNIIQAVIAAAPKLPVNKLEQLIEVSADNGNLLLFIDGLDELSHPQMDKAGDYISVLLGENPLIQIAVAASPDYLDGLVKLGFYPMGVSGWSWDDYQRYLTNWENLWTQFIKKQVIQREEDQIDQRLLVNWLSSERFYLTPLEYTCKVWAAYSGDSLGIGASQAIDSYLTRILNSQVPRSAIGKLALEYCRENLACMSYTQVERFFSRYDPRSEQSAAAPDVTATREYVDLGVNISRNRKNKERKISSGMRAADYLLQVGLLSEHFNEMIRFQNPVFAGYLASHDIEDAEGIILSDHGFWSLKVTAFRYALAKNKLGSYLDKILAMEEAPLYRNLQVGFAGLRDAPTGTEWRSRVMRKMVNLINLDTLPLSIRGRLLAGFIASNDPSLNMLFRQLLVSPSPYVRQLAAIGSGAIGDVKVIQDLIALFNDPNTVIRYAATLSLGAMNHPTATQVLFEGMVRGNEDVRMAAAEVMAYRSTEGHEVLKEAVTMDDILTRRSAVHGLSLIREHWAIEALEMLTIQDGQWVIRNAASQAVECMQKPTHYSPQPVPVAHQSPWLISFASKQGLGVPADHPVDDLLLNALRSGTPEEQLDALNYLRNHKDENVFRAIYQHFYDPQSPIREASVVTLWLMACAGTAIPSPVKFGLGY